MPSARVTDTDRMPSCAVPADDADADAAPAGGTDGPDVAAVGGSRGAAMGTADDEVALDDDDPVRVRPGDFGMRACSDL